MKQKGWTDEAIEGVDWMKLRLLGIKANMPYCMMNEGINYLKAWWSA